MLKKSKAVALICGGISVAATVIFYLLTFDNIFTMPMRYVSLMFLLFVECIGTVKALNVRKSIFGVANILTSFIHLAFVLVMSIIFVNAFPLLLKKYILWNILLLCALFVVDIIIIYFEKYVNEKNNALSESREVIDDLSMKAKALMREYGEGSYKKDLEEISEMLTYSDNSVLSNDEAVISDKLDELRNLLDVSYDRLPQKISELKSIIKLRTLKIKNTKRGNY